MTSILEVLWHCTALVFAVYGTVSAGLAFIDSFILTLFLIFLLSGVVFWLRIPQPDGSLVNEVLGPAWGAYLECDNESQLEDAVKVIGHRACGLDAPENSLSALKKMVDEGIKAVEFDVCLTSDDFPVVFHDDKLERMTSMEGRVSQTLYSDIKALDISVKHTFGSRYGNERIPALKEFVNACFESGVKMVIDLKTGGANSAKLPSHVVDLFKNYPNLIQSAMVSSFNPFIIYEIRSKNPSIVCSLAWRPHYFSYEQYSGRTGPARPRFRNPVGMACGKVCDWLYNLLLPHLLYYILGISAVLIHKDSVTSSLVESWRRRGVRLMAWTVNLPCEKQYIGRGLEITYFTDTVITS